ncbi:hypothetical protein [Kitasatospora aburaviensis]|uniref:FtsK domain-containing protein n=1 Tax=Kitasatospora aburaviensis TaxID=67265 RepID=A0ABW1F998_9ACTN
MTTYPPERIIIDVETEGEFLTDDQPTPNTAGGPADSTTEAADRTGPGLGARLATGTLGLARREYTALRTGLTVVRTERGAWLNASEETAAHLQADLLNRRYNTWTARQKAEAERLEEKAAELEKEARRAASAGQADEATPADHKQAAAAAAALREEAAAWRERAREIQDQTYTGHTTPSDEELERHRRRTANRRRAATAALGLAIGWAELRIGGLLPVLTASGIVGTAWAKGRFPGWRRELPDVPALAYEVESGQPAKDKKDKEKKDKTEKAGTGQAGPAATAPAADGAPLFPGDTGRPFPIHDVTDPAVAVECVRRALLAERVPLTYVGDPTPHPWGWEVVVRVSDGTSGDIGDRLGGLETKFDVGDGDVILQPNRKRTAEAVLRVVTGDLFGAMKPPPYRAPHSVDITDAGVFGMSADGTDLEFSLAELMGEVIARSGGGKSTIIRDLLDWTTAAHNAVTVFLDPSGDGPGKFTDAVKLTSTSPIQIEFALLSLYRLAAGRARIRRKLGMGDTWRCTREHPAIILFVDEFPKLTKRSKQIIAELQLVGRKEGVWLIFAAQGATKELLGSNIAQQPALKIMGACRDVDTTQALGGGAIDWGFLPHRLQPKSGDSLNDCAKSYVIGAPGVSEDPMLHKWHYIPDDEGGRRAAERLAAGLVDVDQASIDAALKAPNPPGLKFADEDEYLHYVPWPELLEMCAEEDDEFGPDGASDEGAELPLPEIIEVLVHALNEEGADALTLGRLHPYLIAHNATRWDRWHDKDEHGLLKEIGRTLAAEFGKAGVDLTTKRLDEFEGSPRGVRRSDVLAVAEQYSE